MTGYKLPAGVSVDAIDQILPQTQCTQCGFEGCRPYAQALAEGEADINRCPPGGPQGVQALARLLQRPELPLDATRGSYGPLEVALIEEEHCIGCTLCIQACPVDAIVGANLRMHTVLADDCTGCRLCVAPCPVDCITMIPVTPERWWQPADARAARERYDRRQERLQWLDELARGRRRLSRSTAGTVEPGPVVSASTGEHGEQTAEALAVAGSTGADTLRPSEIIAKVSDPDVARKAAVAAALARARARRSAT